jgi:CRP-like cAMP-binding protein
VADGDARRRLAQEVLLTSFFGPNDGTRDQWLVDRVVEHMEEVKIATGEVLFREGEPADYLWFVTDGLVRMTAEGHPDWVYRGDWLIGTLDLLAGRKRTRTALVEAQAHAFRVPGKVWSAIFRDSYRIGPAAVIGSAQRLVTTYAQLAPTGGFAHEIERRARFDAAKEALVDRTILLYEAPYFRLADAQALVDLAQLATTARFDPGAHLFTHGASPRDILVVIEGEVEVSRQAPQVNARFGPGQVVGAAICLGDVEAAWSATAVSPTSVLQLAITDWFDAMEEHPSLTRAAMIEMSLERERLLDLRAAESGEIILD